MTRGSSFQQNRTWNQPLQPTEKGDSVQRDFRVGPVLPPYLLRLAAGVVFDHVPTAVRDHVVTFSTGRNCKRLSMMLGGTLGSTKVEALGEDGDAACLPRDCLQEDLSSIDDDDRRWSN
eukprot:776561-Amphidinium_carterae.2